MTAEPRMTPHDMALLAAGCLMLDDARLCGLIDPDATIDRARCLELLHQAKRDGVVVSEEDCERAALRIMAALGVLSE